MNIIRKKTTAELNADDITCLERLAVNLDLCTNEHTLSCSECPFENLEDYCIPALARNILSRNKGKTK